VRQSQADEALSWRDRVLKRKGAELLRLIAQLGHHGLPAIKECLRRGRKLIRVGQVGSLKGMGQALPPTLPKFEGNYGRETGANGRSADRE
jgi:hypothetical protein